MKIEKLPSGSYRVRKMVDGKTYSLTFDHRPTQKEIQEEINIRKTGNRYGKLTFGYACQEYIDDRSNTLSPASVKEYHNRLDRISAKLSDTLVDDITSNDIQREINNYSEGRAAKTVKNQYLFMQSVLGAYRDDLRLKVKLPAQKKKEPYIPSTEDIKALLEYFKDTQMELCIRLASLSLRRGEICALSPEDLEGNYLTISKDKVRGIDNKWIIKDTPKTDASNRTIYVPDRIVELFNTVGFYQGNPDVINHKLIKAEDALGLPHFSIHKMRHYFASTALETMSDIDVMAFGGWNSDVMKRVYRHRMHDNTKKVSEAITSQLD